MTHMRECSDEECHELQALNLKDYSQSLKTPKCISN